MTAFVFRNRLLAVILWLALLAWGIIAYRSISRREDPDVPVRFGQIIAVLPGASTEQVEQLLVDRIERTLLALDDVQKVESRCRPGMGILKVQARDATGDLAKFWSLVRDRLSDLQPELPPGTLPLQINDHFGDTSALIYGVVWPGASERQREDVARRLRDRLRTLSPLAEVTVLGEQSERIEVLLDSGQLSHYRINPQQLADRLSQRNILPLLAGTAETPQLRWLTDTAEPLADLEGLRQLPISPSLKLGDIAQIRKGLPDPPVFQVRVQGQPGVAVSVTMRKGEDILWTGQRVEAEVERLRAQLPAGCQLVKVNDLPTSVKGRISEFNHNLRDGVLLILVITFAFMGLRSAALVGVMLPITILGTYAIMQLCGRELQQMSITALIIALGLVVDNSVVVVDNIEHQLSQGLTPQEAAQQGADQIRLPLLTSNLTTVAAFLPLAFLPGGKGDFIRDLGLVTSLATLISLVLNLTLLPFLCRYFLKPVPGSSQNRALHLLGRLAERALRRPRLVTAAAIALTCLAVLVLPVLGVQFFPSAQRSQFVVEVWTRDGTPLQSTARSTIEVEKWLSSQPEVASQISYLGRGGPRFYYNVDPEAALSNYAQIVVNTHSVAATEALVTRMRALVLDHFPQARVVPRKLEQGPPVGAPVALRLQGENGESLRQVADQLVSLLQKQPGVFLAYHDLGERSPQLDLSWDQQKLAELGLTSQDVAQATRISLNGLTVTRLRQGDREIPVDLRARAPLEELTLFGSHGQVVPMASLTHPRVVPGVWRHSRFNRIPTCNIYGHVDYSRLPSKILAGFLPEAKALVPASVQLSYGGEQEEVDKSLRELALVFLSAALGQLLIVAWEFNNLRTAAAILAAVPFSLFGGVLGLALTGNAFSFTAFLGLITLGGVVTNHAIMFFEYTREQQEKGLEMVPAMLSAGRLRIRPILLTILLSIGGLLPLAIGGGNLWPPMAWTLIFGLIYSLPLALVIVPSFYASLSSWKQRTLPLALLVWLSGSGSAQAQPWSLQEVRTRALARHPQLDEYVARYRQAEARVREAESGANPRLNLQTTSTYLNPTVQLSAPGLTLNGSLPVNWSSGVVLEQSLLNFGRVGWAVRSAELSQQAAYQDYRAALQQTWEESALRFYELAERAAQVEVAHSAVRVSLQGLEDARRLQRAGASPRFDLLRAESDYKATQLQQVQVEQAWQVSRARLLTLLELSPGDPLEISLADSDVPESTELPVALAQALDARPELVSLEQLRQASLARASQEAAQLNPNLGLRLDYLHQNPNAFRSGVQFTAGLVLSIPLYDGGQSAARTTQFEQESLRLEAQLRQNQRLVKVEVETLFHRLRSDRQALEVTEAQQTSARESERVARLRYQHGIASQLEWLDAQRQRTSAEQARVTAEYQYRGDQARWQRVLGRDPYPICRSAGGELLEQEKSLPSR